MYRAVLDTCALVPGLQRDFLLQLAAEGAYAPLWGTGILKELDYVLARLDVRAGRTDRAPYRARLLEQMQNAFPGATVVAPKDGTCHYDIDDPCDGHVAHAAVLGKADAIVTDDRRAGFTMSADLSAASIEVVSPANFAADAVAAQPSAGRRAVQVMSNRFREPSLSPAELLNIVAARYRTDDAADMLRAVL